MKKLFTLLLIIFVSFCSINANGLNFGGNEYVYHSDKTVIKAAQKHLSIVKPNPANTTTNISFYNPNENGHRIEIYDIIGNNVRVYNNIFSAQKRIDVTELNAGLYFYFIIKGNNERVSTGRLIVRR